MVANELNLSSPGVFHIVTEDIAMTKMCTKLVPKVLSDDQKTDQAEVSTELLPSVENEPWYLNKSSSDET